MGLDAVAYTALCLFAALLCLTIGVEYLLGMRTDANEPRYLSPRVPIIGHLIGIFCDKNLYYIKLRLAVKPPPQFLSNQRPKEPDSLTFQSILSTF